MRPYSLDLRERILAAVDHAGSIRWINSNFALALLYRPPAPGRRAPARSLPATSGGGPPPALGPGDLERLAALVREQRRDVGATEAARRLHVQPEDPVVRPRSPRPDPQEEEPARQPAGPARRAGEA